MEEYVSRYINRLDAKGRVSIPARFRAIIQFEGGDDLFCHPALENQALDCGGPRLIEQIRGLLSELPAYSDEKDQLATALFGESELIKIDGDGRVILPERLVKQIGAQDQVLFVGLGDKFQIWAPDQFEAYREKARTKIRGLRNKSQKRKNS